MYPGFRGGAESPFSPVKGGTDGQQDIKLTVRSWVHRGTAPGFSPTRASTKKALSVVLSDTPDTAYAPELVRAFIGFGSALDFSASMGHAG